MIAIEGQNNYIVYVDENGIPYGGEPLPEGTTLISNLEDVSNDKIEVYTP